MIELAKIVNLINILIDSYIIIVMLILLTGKRGSDEKRGDEKWDKGLVSIYLIILLIFLLLLIDVVDHSLLVFLPQLKILGKLTDCATNIVYYSILAAYTLYVRKHITKYRKLPKWPVWVVLAVAAVSAVLWCVSVFNGMFYRYDMGEEGYGPYYWLGQSGGYYLVLMQLYYILRYIGRINKRDAFSFLSFILFPVIASVVRNFFPGFSFMPISLSLSALLLFNRIYTEQMISYEQQRAQLAQERIRTLMGTIRPHFIFNVLNSIYVLCEKDPEAAQTAVGEFSEYLRGNFQMMDGDGLIPFSEELENVKHYLNLEQMRFGDELQYELDIDCTGFRIPALALQPIVENAVKHGIARKEGGGCVWIFVKDRGETVEISVKDNGVGFDPEKKLEGTHIGIANVRERLALLCDGGIKIESRPGEGTLAVISLKKGREEDEDTGRG